MKVIASMEKFEELKKNAPKVITFKNVKDDRDHREF